MRALLVNPWIYDFAAYDLWSKPLGLLTIASHLKKLKFDVSLIDCLDRFHPALKKKSAGRRIHNTAMGSGSYLSEPIKKPDIYKDTPRRYKRYGIPLSIFGKLLLNEEHPDVILVTSGMTYWYPSYIDTISILKKRFPKTPIVLGGIYANLCYEHAKKFSGADIVYKGSEMRGILDLVTGVMDIGRSRTMGGKTAYLPPAYELYDDLRYVTLRTSRGCPFRCTYCGWYILENAFHQTDAKIVTEEIEYYYRKRGIRNFAFYDEALLFKPEGHIIKILEKLIADRIKANFHTPNGLHNRFVTPEIAGLMKKSGFVQPRLALETSYIKRQVQTGAKTTNEDFLNAVRYLKDAGYGAGDIAAYLLIGLPDQSIDEIKGSVRFAVSEKVRIFLEEYSPIPGTIDYAASGLAPDADPLLHNNSAFPLYDTDHGRRLQEIKDMVHKLNVVIAGRSGRRHG